ncbi:hypothetical protein [Halobellus marinus]|uniref:hypothetical protein n=1 Tax=Halobellus TaxID=1073986 RepID=UPI0028A92126|nr:hypothetical protein [Halobellus sp. DFY28]
MSEEFPDPGGDPFEEESFDEWLEQQAATQGLSREELFEQLISSYWTLTEMTQLLENTGSTDPPFDPSQSESSTPLPTDIGSEGTDADRREPNEIPSDDAAETDRGHEAIVDRLDELQDRVDELESTLESEVERGQSLDAVAEAVVERISEIEAELDGLATELDSTRESVTDDYDSLAEDIDDLEAELSREKDTRATAQQKLTAEQDQIRSWLDTEFDNLETVLEYLISRTDELETDIESADSHYGDALSRLRWERDVLDSLKRDAAAAGVHAGECESCAETVDLDLLSRPYCPNCESILTGIEERDKWLFFSEAVVTTKGNGAGSDAHGSTRAGAGIEPAEHTTASSPSQAGPGQDPDARSADSDRTTQADAFEKEPVGGESTENGGGDFGTTDRPKTEQDSSPGAAIDRDASSSASREYGSNEPEESPTEDTPFEFTDAIENSPPEETADRSGNRDDAQSFSADGNREPMDRERDDSDVESTFDNLGEWVRQEEQKTDSADGNSRRRE